MDNLDIKVPGMIYCQPSQGGVWFLYCGHAVCVSDQKAESCVLLVLMNAKMKTFLLQMVLKLSKWLPGRAGR